MREVASAADLPEAVRAARSEADIAFGDPSVYLERRLMRPRHVEVQLLGDDHGAVLPFVERECSIQRRHQKVVEETPSVAVSGALRGQIADAAARIAREAGYTNAGTVEFLLDEGGRFYFLEMNTRLQVEHPITEIVTGVDLVQWQIRIADHGKLDLDPGRLLVPVGHAIECRVYAEDPDNDFLPSPGRITELQMAGGPGIRTDAGVSAGLEVPVHYDPMLSKLIAWAEDRPAAVSRMRRALAEHQIVGVKTTVPFFCWLFDQPDFLEGRFHTAYLDDALRVRNGRPFLTPSAAIEEVAAMAATLDSMLPADDRLSDFEKAPAAVGLWKARARAEAVGAHRQPARGGL
jgi:acetyl-CoA carboxylase biotin carboxylase subunit